MNIGDKADATNRVVYLFLCEQVKSVMKASVAEGVGQKAVGADEKVKKASEEALADIAKATQR